MAGDRSLFNVGFHVGGLPGSMLRRLTPALQRSGPSSGSRGTKRLKARLVARANCSAGPPAELIAVRRRGDHVHEKASMRKVLWVFAVGNGLLLVLALLFSPGSGLDIFQVQTHVLYYLGYLLATSIALWVCHIALTKGTHLGGYVTAVAGVNVLRALVFHSQPLASWPGGDDGPGMGWAFILMPATFWIGVSALLAFVPLLLKMTRAKAKSV